MRNIKTGASVAALSALVVLATAGCHPGASSAEASTSSSPASVVAGAGSTFVAPLMTAWINGYQHAHPKNLVNYRSIGSGGGIDEFKKGWLGFAASDAPLSDDQVKEISPTIQVPGTAGPVCIIYNLPGLARTLKLSSKALAGIYLGTVISWQDPLIVKDNPGVTLPKAAVIVIHRSDGSGTTNILTTYLSKVNHDWSWKVGQGLAVTWPTGLGGEGSKGVLGLVKEAPGAIGYLELNYAKENGVPVASIQNNAGEFIAPTTDSTIAAIEAFQPAVTRDVRTPIVDPPASAKGAYPISGFTFLLLPKDRPSRDEQAAARDFVAYAISTGQESATGLSYAKLPPFMQQQAQNLLAQLTVNGQAMN